MYPPLGILLTSTVYRWFGATFAATNLLLDILSTVTVLVTWRLALRLLSDRLALATALAFACLGATNGGTLALFSLTLYTPSILTGAIGLGLAIISALDLVADDSKVAPKGLLVVGATLALLSKLEHGAAACVMIAVLAICKLPASRTIRTLARWAVHYFVIGLGSIAPSALAYAIIARVVGTDNLLAGASGYGIAAQYCPLWPNGLGLLGALAALGLAAAFLSALILFYGRPWKANPTRVVTCLAIIAGGVLVWVYHLRFALADFGIAQPSLSGFRLLGGYCFSMSGLLGPFMWSTILLFFLVTVRAARAIRTGTLRQRDAALAVVTVPIVLLASRGMFGSMFSNVTTVHQASYSVLLPFVPYLLLYAQNLVDAVSGVASDGPYLPGLRARPSRRAWALLAIVATVATVPRLVKATARPRALRLETLAGHVYMGDEASRAAYAYVLSHSRPNDRILEVPIGGGLSFATRRWPATYSTQFNGLLTPPRLMRLDVERVRVNPPQLVFAMATANFGATYGVCARCACVFPRLVWRSDRLACDPTQSFEALDLIHSRYEPRAHFGIYVVLSPRQGM